MLGVRVNSFNENMGEPEQDANSALTELDKGLRSGKVGEQCEAIVRFPKLFEKYPFPILINASLLKLADVFRMGNNFLRLCILRVCQQSEKHLDKISNVDEFLRRVYSVIHSNDPIARAVTLRTFGAVASIIPERQQIHHSIRRSLDSHDNVEVEAAIYGAIQFAAQSKSFAISMCNKVSHMIQGQATTASMKLQLIPILQYMHHDTSTAAMVRSLCLDLLPSYPAQDFVLVILNTLTKLAATTLVHIPDQVTLLLKYLKDDPRWEVKSKALQHLYELAKPGAHIWPAGAADELIEYIFVTKRNKILMPGLCVIQILMESPRMCVQHKSSGTKLRELCDKESYSINPAIQAQAIHISTQILCYCFRENIQPEGAEDVIVALETLILFLTHNDEHNLKHLRMALKCIVRLCEANSDYCETFVELLGSRLDNIESNYIIVICEALGAIGSLKPDTLLSQKSTILDLLNSISTLENSNQLQTKTRIMLCTLIFQLLSGYKWDDATQNAIFETINANKDLWSNYSIGRAAVRYGHHQIGTYIFKQLTEQVSSEHFHFWLASLKEMTEAEALLSNTDLGSLISRLDGAAIHYNKAIAALKAASTPLHNLSFQAEYMRIRTEFLQCLSQLFYTCNILCIVPPPAIAAAIVQNTRDEHQRYGYVTNQLRKCVKEFKNCGDLHWKLYQTAFDADPVTLENMQILQQMCVLIEQCLETVCTSSSRLREGPMEFGSKTVKLECKDIVTACENVSKAGQNLLQDAAASTITHRQIEILKKIVEIVANARLPVPRFFFQILQSTSVKLAISPQPRVMGEFISVQSNSHLAVKVEGVIQHGINPGLFRKIAQVAISVTSHMQNTSKNKDVDPKTLEQYSVLHQTVTPHRDFFSAQFLIAFQRGGQYLLALEASVVDEENNTWKTGPKSSLTVKVPEEQKLAPIQIPGISTNGNVILMPEDSLFIKPYQKKPV